MKKVNLDEEVALMLDELLNTEAFSTSPQYRQQPSRYAY